MPIAENITWNNETNVNCYDTRNNTIGFNNSNYAGDGNWSSTKSSCINGNNGTTLLHEDLGLDTRRTIYLTSVPLMLVFCTFATVTNLAIVASTRLVRRPLSPTLFFSVSLAGADAYAALVLGVGLFFNSLLPVGLGLQTWDICASLAFEALRLGGVISTAAHLLALALTHYVGILRPLHYARLVTRRRCLVTVTFLWVVPIAFFFVYFAAHDAFGVDECSYVFLGYSRFRNVVASLFFFPLLCMLVTYSHMFVLVRQHQRGLRRTQTRAQLHRSLKAATTTLLILGTYIIGWLPGVMSYLLICVDCRYTAVDLSPYTSLVINIVVNILIILKCLTDPVIYAARMPEIQAALRRMGGCVPRRVPDQRNSRTQNTLLPLLSSSRQRFSISTTSSSRRCTLPVNGAAIPLRTFKAASAARRQSNPTGA